MVRDYRCRCCHFNGLPTHVYGCSGGIVRVKYIKKRWVYRRTTTIVSDVTNRSHRNRNGRRWNHCQIAHYSGDLIFQDESENVTECALERAILIRRKEKIKTEIVRERQKVKLYVRHVIDSTRIAIGNTHTMQILRICVVPNTVRVRRIGTCSGIVPIRKRPFAGLGTPTPDNHTRFDWECRIIPVEIPHADIRACSRLPGKVGHVGTVGINQDIFHQFRNRISRRVHSDPARPRRIGVRTARASRNRIRRITGHRHRIGQVDECEVIVQRNGNRDRVRNGLPDSQRRNGIHHIAGAARPLV